MNSLGEEICWFQGVPGARINVSVWPVTIILPPYSRVLIKHTAREWMRKNVGRSHQLNGRVVAKRKEIPRSPLSRAGLGVLAATLLLGGLVLSWEIGKSHETTAGTYGVIDGDTLEVGGRTIRISGIDAPELGQLCRNNNKVYRCGLEAALTLKRLISVEGKIDCRAAPGRPKEEKSCQVGNRDVGEAMLRQGYAVALPSAPATYRSAEQGAKSSRLGLWRGDFMMPAAWRDGQRLPEIEGEPRQACDIKGRITDKGVRHYLVPTDPGYEEIEIDRSRGERLFCSDDEAELAGWRRGRRR